MYKVGNKFRNHLLDFVKKKKDGSGKDDPDYDEVYDDEDSSDDETDNIQNAEKSFYTIIENEREIVDSYMLKVMSCFGLIRMCQPSDSKLSESTVEPPGNISTS